MQPADNRIPEKVGSIHLIAICGTAMGALAAMLKASGYRVTGSDQKVYPPMSSFLAALGIDVADGFSPKNLEYRPDLVVVGNAISQNNPEVAAIEAMHLSYCSMPQAINRFIVSGKKTVVVTGTHGKTTTASMIAWLLQDAGRDPSFVIGGILKNFDSNYRLGTGEVVLEGDEYDTAFFDKGPKFLHYRPSVAVLTGVEFDHADIYRDLDHVKSAFDQFIDRIPPDATLLAWDGDPVIKQLITGRRCRIAFYGKQPQSQWQLGETSLIFPWTYFEVHHRQRLFGRFKTKVFGTHNLLNATAAVGAAYELGVGVEAIARGLETFSGVRRRQEIRGVAGGVTVVDDFAHHPTAVRETISAFRPLVKGGRLIAVFEPRTNSSMRNVFQAVYATVFDPADIICIRQASMLEKIAPEIRFSGEKLVEDLRARGKYAEFFQDTEAIIAFLKERACPGDLVLIMSNGGFDNIHERLLAALNGEMPTIECRISNR